MKLKNAKWQRLAAVAVTGATIILPLVGTAGAAQADPYDYAPGRGWHQARDDYRSRLVVGTVTRHLHGNTFELRTDAGRLLPVIMHDRGPLSFGLNERVELTGHFSDGNFIADTVRFLHDDGRGGFRGLVKTKFNARVLELRSAHRLVVRSEYGHVYDVDAVNGFSNALRPGDGVRVIGYGNDRFVRADTIRR